MRNSCRADDPRAMMEFTVTPDHVRLLRRLNMKSMVLALDGPESGHYFQTCPGVDAKRPFGNSGDPAWCALEALGIEPAGEDGNYGPDQLMYGQYLALSLPMAYEAVMSHGAVEPCTAEIDRYGGACASFRRGRVLAFWRDAIDAACAADGVPAGQLVALLANARDKSSPMGPLSEIRNTSPGCPWMRAALDAMKPFAVRKCRLCCPGAADRPDGDVWDGLLSGRYALEWPW